MLYSIMQNKLLTLFTVLLLPITLLLGFWQLDRAAEKSHLLASVKTTDQLKTLQSAAQLTSLPTFQHVQLSGYYVHPYMWFLDNQVWQGEAGVDVIALLQIDDTLVLVNRGWYAWRDRAKQPQIAAISGPVTLQGNMVVPSEKGLLLLADSPSSSYPQLLQKIDMQLLKRQLDLPLHGQVLYLNAVSDTALQPHWKPVNMTPAKHYGYAVQWFGLGLTLCILYLFRIYKFHQSHYLT